MTSLKLCEAKTYKYSAVLNVESNSRHILNRNIIVKNKQYTRRTHPQEVYQTTRDTSLQIIYTQI